MNEWMRGLKDWAAAMGRIGLLCLAVVLGALIAIEVPLLGLAVVALLVVLAVAGLVKPARQVGLVLLFLLAFVAIRAKGQQYTNVFQPTFYRGLTNFPQLLTNGQTLTLWGERIPMPGGRGLGLAMKVNGTNACTGNVQATVETSVDGTTNSQTTTTPFTVLVPLKSAAAQVGGTNISRTASQAGPNFRDVVVTTIVNPHTNSIWVSNVWWTVENN